MCVWLEGNTVGGKTGVPGDMSKAEETHISAVILASTWM